MATTITRDLIWKPIERAPHKQTVLIWHDGKWSKGSVWQDPGGWYEVIGADQSVIIGATHYALVEGP